MTFLEFPEFGAKISPQGGQLLAFRDWIFLSPDAVFAPQKAIRGGIPLVFPYFGAHPHDKNAPQHGHARTALWETVSQREKGAILRWNYAPFALEIEFGFSDSLEIALRITNTGAESARFEALLHTYFRVGDVTKIEIEGLDGAHYLDKFDEMRRKTSRGNVKIAVPTDRVYENCGGPLRILDGNRAFSMAPLAGWHSTVVWNPFGPLSDARGEAWREFVCVESGAVGPRAPEIAGGQTYELSTKIDVTAV